MRRYLIALGVGGFFLTASLFVGINAGDKKEGKDLPKSESPKSEEKKAPPPEPSVDEEILKRAEVPAGGEALVKFFQARTLPENQRPVMQRLIQQLGSTDYRARAKAASVLTSRGVAVLEVLRASRPGQDDLETARRIESAIHSIHDKDVGAEVTAAAVRYLGVQKPASFLETLLAYAPFADKELILEELRAVLSANSLKDGKAHPCLLDALTDRSAARRALAGEALARSAYTANKEKLDKLLQDSDPLVRCRVAQTLVYKKHKEPVTTLIDVLVDVPLQNAWQTEDLLLRLAVGLTPPDAPMGNGKDAREKCRLGWQAWWKKNADKVDLAKLEEPAKLLGRTLIVLLDEGKVVELGHDNLPRVEFKNLVFPLDVQLLDDNRLLVAEYHAKKISERDARNDTIRWTRTIEGPLVAQRLANGNTFIATDAQFLEYDKDGQEVLNVVVSEDGRQILKAMKLPNGEIVCMTADARVVRYSAKGDEVHSFPIPLGMRLFGGRVHVLPTGRVLVPHNAENKVTEYDARGNVIWEVAFEQPVAATRISNGNTLITSMNPAVGAVEVDRLGEEVWSYRDTTRVTRAIRR